MSKPELSVITAIKPKYLSKGFSLGTDGTLKKSSGGLLIEGRIERRTINSLSDLASVLLNLGPSQALAYGVPLNGTTRLMTRRNFATAGRPSDATTRTKEDFSWPNGPGVMMLDYDPWEDVDPLGCKELVDRIRRAAPGLATAEMLWFPSASSCIWLGDTELRGISGQRLYLLVEDASDIPRAGKALYERLWLAGYGHIRISSAGSLLERTLVDAAVWQPSRLDFAGGAACSDGLEQRRGDPRVIEGSSGIINSRLAIPDLSAEQRREVRVSIKEAKRAKKPEAEAIRRHWFDARIDQIVSQANRDTADGRQQAETAALNALESGLLSGDFRIDVEVEGHLRSLSVRELLANPEQFHLCQTRDPLEPDYDGGRIVGQLYLLQARPKLHSFAHGGNTFSLQRAQTWIEVAEGRMSEAVEKTLELLRQDPLTFDFGGQLAIVEDGRVHLLCEHSLSLQLGSVVQYQKRRRTGDRSVLVDCNPPPDLLKQILALGDRRRLKPLRGVITAPTIRPDGSVLDKPGYDPDTGLFLDPPDTDIPLILLKPTIEKAKIALDILLYPFRDFPFVDEKARGALLAALLTAAVRQVLPTAPAFAFDAPAQGSGKSLLANCIGALAEGRVPDVWPHTHGRDDEEIRKRLFAALRTGHRALVWDNVIGVFDSASIAALLTSVSFSDRLLGKSESLSLPNRMLLILTGNNLQLAGDLPRRVISCRIDPKTEEPFARQFNLDPLQWCLDNRMLMLSAACTLIRAQMSHMKEPARGKLASFELWDTLVRQTVAWVNTELCQDEFCDPMELVREAQSADPEAQALLGLLQSLKDIFGEREFSSSDVVAVSRLLFDTDDLVSALSNIAGPRALSSTLTLGKILKIRTDRIVNGLCLQSRRDKTSNTLMFRVAAKG